MRVSWIFSLVLLSISSSVFCQQDLDWEETFFGIKGVTLDQSQKKSLRERLEEQYTNKAKSSPRVNMSIGNSGVIVLEVEEIFTETVANIKPNDVIVKVSDQQIKSLDDLASHLNRKTIATFELLRPTQKQNKVEFDKITVEVRPKSRFDLVMSMFESKADQFKDTTFYTHRLASYSPLSAYVAEKPDGTIYQILRIRHQGQIIGLKGATVLINSDRKFEIQATLEERIENTIIGTTSVEWFDRHAREYADLISAIKSADVVSIRLHGTPTVKDHDVTKNAQIIFRANELLIQALEWRNSKK